MAEIAGPAITFLLENLKQTLTYYANLKSDAKRNLEGLSDDLEILKGFLQDAAQRKKKNEYFKKIEKQIRDVVYDVEDTIDSCLTQNRTEKERGRGFSRLLGGKNRLSLAKQVKDIREKTVREAVQKAQKALKDLPDDRDNESKTLDSQPSKKPRKHPVIREDNVVGFEDEIDKITAFLIEETGKLDVHAIIGMAGLGKTTLAYKVFKNPDIQFKYPTSIWVTVSQDFNMMDVLLTIMKHFTGADLSGMDKQGLANLVRENLKRGNYLLVFDDVWKADHWDEIRKVLPIEHKGKVLVTSRNLPVGKHACGGDTEPHELRFLTGKESWQLLELEVFKEPNACPGYLVETGNRIATQCHGLPLALVVIGGILVEKTSESMGKTAEEWENVAADVSKHVAENKEQNVKDIVSWSYDNLPDNLTDCFIYLGVFPEDYEIPTSTLTRLWIAEGFIEGKSLEDTANDNLKELINRNLVMVGRKSIYGEVKTVRVHDVIRAFCISKGKEHNMYQEVKLTPEGVFHPDVTDKERKYRRLCIHSHLVKFFSKTENAQAGVRSFLSFYKEPFILPKDHTSSIPDAFNLLRVLESKTFKFPIFPTKLPELIHLRYLTLFCNNLELVPEAICELWNLQTLLVNTSFTKLTVQGDISKLTKLRHLKTKTSLILARRLESKGGDNLQTISGLSPRYCTEEVFAKACNLRKLGIHGEIRTLVGDTTLGSLQRLENLKLFNAMEFGSPADNPLQDLPGKFPPNLKMLTLSRTYMDWRHMATLGTISTLKVLKLKDNAFRGDYWKMVPAGFSSLQHLLIANTDLAVWTVSDDNCFAALESIVLDHCVNLNGIPEKLANVKSLRNLELSHVLPSVVESAHKIDDIRKGKMKEGKKKEWSKLKLTIGPESKISSM